LFSGHDAVANMMGECLYELARNSKIQNKLRNELLAFEHTHGHPPTAKNLLVPETLPFLDAVTSETIRCKGSVMALHRVAPHDDMIPLDFPVSHAGKTEIFVQEGQEIIIPIRDGRNVDESIWGLDASTFRPDRWLNFDGLPDEAQSLRTNGNTVSFGDGPKVCFGRHLPVAEFKIVISQLVRNFEFKSVGEILNFFHLGGYSVKPRLRGQEAQGVQLPLGVRLCSTSVSKHEVL